VGPVEPSPAPGPPATLRVLADTELRNVSPELLGELKAATGIELRIDHQNTRTATELLAAGDSSYDLAWLPSDRYLSLLRAESGQRHPESQPTMLSPVVLGVRRQVAQSFGWSSGMRVPWVDIAAQASTGQLRYAMADPGASFTGLAALLGVATGAAGTGNALRLEDIQEDPLRRFAAGMELPSETADSVVDPSTNNKDRPNERVNYEAPLLSLNPRGKLPEPLELIYPKEGIITADYPLMLLKDDQRNAYQRVLNWLRSDSVQRIL